MEKKPSIYTLPVEIIVIVLKECNVKDIVNLSSTCKHFNEIINNCHGLWREKFKNTLPVVYEVANKYGNGLWIDEFKGFMKQKQLIYSELLKMSPKYYWKTEEFSLNDMGYFFTIASNHSLSYYYTIYILQELIKQGNKNTNQYYTQKPFTLTEMFYAKAILRYLKHCYLAVKWVKGVMDNELPPENVVNFFLQWIDTLNFHFMEDVEKKVQEIVDIVADYLVKTYPNQLEANNSYSAFQIFSGVSHILFQERHLSMTTSADLDSLDIKEVYNKRIGNQTIVFALYQAVARRLGAHTELIVFANHMFLEWRCEEIDQVYTVNIISGSVEAKRRCPFAQANINARYRYHADALLHSLHVTYVNCMGSLKSWTLTNATDLLGFLGGNYCVSSPYDNFYRYLIRNPDLIPLDSDLNIRYLTDKELKIILSLLRLHAMAPKSLGKKVSEEQTKPLEVKTHHSSVRYAVGMICSHKKHNYDCIIRGWDRTCNVHWRTSISNDKLTLGHNQPYYRVVSMDQSERYIAQELLSPITRPSRMYHLEDIVAKDFSYFDGFSYVLNDEKRMEYPDETIIVEVFKQRYLNVNNDNLSCD